MMGRVRMRRLFAPTLSVVLVLPGGSSFVVAQGPPPPHIPAPTRPPHVPPPPPGTGKPPDRVFPPPTTAPSHVDSTANHCAFDLPAGWVNDSSIKSVHNIAQVRPRPIHGGSIDIAVMQGDH